MTEEIRNIVKHRRRLSSELLDPDELNENEEEIWSSLNDTIEQVQKNEESAMSIEGRSPSSSGDSGQIFRSLKPTEVARGWMFKWRDKFPQSWQYRLFILQDAGTMRYYKSVSGGSLQQRGVIDIHSLKFLNGFPGSIPSKWVDKGTTIFIESVQPNKENRRRAFALRCESVESKDRWMKTIREARTAWRARAERNRSHSRSTSDPTEFRSGELAFLMAEDTSGVVERFENRERTQTETVMKAKELQALWNMPYKLNLVVKCGWLLKLRHKGPANVWQRRFFVLRKDFLMKYYSECKGTLVETGEISVDGLSFVEDERHTGSLNLTFEAFQQSKMRRRRFTLCAGHDIGLQDPVFEIREWRQVLEHWKACVLDPDQGSKARRSVMLSTFNSREKQRQPSLSSPSASRCREFEDSIDAILAGTYTDALLTKSPSLRSHNRSDSV